MDVLENHQLGHHSSNVKDAFSIEYMWMASSVLIYIRMLLSAGCSLRQLTFVLFSACFHVVIFPILVQAKRAPLII